MRFCFIAQGTWFLLFPPSITVPREIAFEHEISDRENDNNRADGENHARKYDVVLRESQRIYCHCVLAQMGSCAACSELQDNDEIQNIWTWKNSTILPLH